MESTGKRERTKFLSFHLKILPLKHGNYKSSRSFLQTFTKILYILDRKGVEEKLKSETCEYTVVWDQNLLDVIRASFSKISWQTYQSQACTAPWTLVHGDFHPANMMVRKGTNNLILLDWEVVGVGCGPQDLGQYVISHMSAAARRSIEESALQYYYDLLTKEGSSTVTKEAYSWSQCRSDYVMGGAERWIWLLAVITRMCPEPMVQFFHDQVKDFILDHGITPHTIGMPRI